VVLVFGLVFQNHWR
jgi:hypothetical protein